MITKFNTKFVLLGALAILFVGCAKKGVNLYYWDRAYASSMYQYLSEGGDMYKQISSVENSVQKAHASGAKIPPGLYAHLGLLYSNVGESAKSKMYLNKEAQAYPESASYIAFLNSSNLGKK